MRTQPIALAAAMALMTPAVAFGQQTQGGDGTRVAEGCLQELQAFNQELVESGYGAAGPRGYGMESGVYRGFRAGTAFATPRGEMRTVLTAAQIFALNGDQEACRTILASAQDLHRERIAQLEAMGVEPDETMTWRAERLTTAVPVSELPGQVQVDDLIGADVRNPAGEDLGDVNEVVLGRDGQVRYVLVARGGFLGFGEDLIPVRWEDLRITAAPYDDTVVLNVREETFANAPTIDEDVAEALGDDNRRLAVDNYWEENLER